MARQTDQVMDHGDLDIIQISGNGPPRDDSATLLPRRHMDVVRPPTAGTVQFQASGPMCERRAMGAYTVNFCLIGRSFPAERFR